MGVTTGRGECRHQPSQPIDQASVWACSGQRLSSTLIDCGLMKKPIVVTATQAELNALLALAIRGWQQFAVFPPSPLAGEGPGERGS